MLQPVSYVLNSNFVKTNSKNDKQVFVNDIPNNNQTELANYEVSRAILNRNSISFRNLSQPIEVTDKYNKKIEGKDHLDLPNIHMYEYPDTNLQVIVNTQENSKLNTPKYSIMIENNEYKKHDLLKEKLLYFLLNNRDDLDIVNTSFCFSIFDSENADLLNAIDKINHRVFNLKFDNQDLNTAKKKLNAFLESPEYISTNKSIKKLYKDTDLKTDDELQTEIENITCTDMQKYYKEYLNNSNVSSFLTIPKDYFEKNKNTVLKLINPKTNLKFLTKNIAVANIPKFIGNMTIIDKSTLKIPTKATNTKDSLIENIAINILNSNEDFSTNYSLDTDYFSIPLELKNTSPVKYHCKFCNVNINNDNKNFKDFSQSLNLICKNNLKQEVEKQKNEIKEKLKQTFTGERLDLIKHLELMSYSDEIFNLYENIDSIEENDIKQYYKNLISVQDKEIT